MCFSNGSNEVTRCRRPRLANSREIISSVKAEFSVLFAIEPSIDLLLPVNRDGARGHHCHLTTAGAIN